MEKRQIKFRAWMPDLKQMIYPDKSVNTTLIIEHNGNQWQMGEADVDWEIHGAKSYQDDVLMQFTGLLDKNGVEIYEGDVFKTLSDRIGKVVFDRGGFVAYIDETSQETISYAADQQIEIIGNIYQHPNLLTEPTGK